jgi:hypothetical protein
MATRAKPKAKPTPKPATAPSAELIVTASQLLLQGCGIGQLAPHLSKEAGRTVSAKEAEAIGRAALIAIEADAQASASQSDPLSVAIVRLTMLFAGAVRDNDTPTAARLVRDLLKVQQEAAKTQSGGGAICVTPSEFANMVGVTTGYIAKLDAAGLLERESSTKIRLIPSVKKYVAHLRRKSGPSEAELRETEAKATLKEIELACRRGELVAASRVQDTLAQLAAVFRRGRVQHGEEFARAVQQAVAEWQELTVKRLQAEDGQDD